MRIDLLIRADGPGSNHGSEAQSQTTDTNDPRVGDHQPIHEASLHHLPGRQADNANAQTSVQERVVQVLPLVHGHAAVVPGLAVEDEVDRDEGAAEDGAADQQLAHPRAGEGALLLLRLLVVRPGGAARARKGILGRPLR